MERFLFVFIATVLASGWAAAENTDPEASAPSQFNEATVADLEAKMAAGTITSVQLTKYYLHRILALDQNGPGVNSVIELNPEAIRIADQMDDLRMRGKVLGPLHGIPVLIKDNIDTGDRMQTSAGSGRGGQTNNPYGINRNPCGSSSGSGAAASANFAVLAFGSETDGSIVCPSNANGVVGIKPTVGLTSRAGVVPISHTQDTVGPIARTVADAAAALGVIQSRTYDGRDPATGSVPLGWKGRLRPTNIPTDYTQFLNPKGLQGARLGLTRAGLGGFDPLVPTPQPVLDAFEEAVEALTAAGATVIDLDAAGFTFPSAGGESLVLDYDFRNDVKAYFATRVGVPVAGGTLQSAIDFDNAHADVEMPFFNQDVFDQAQSLAPGPDDPQPVFGGMTYNQALEIDRRSGVNGIDAALTRFDLDAVVSATDNPAWATDLVYGDHFIFGTSGLAAPQGYPIVQVPAGMVFGVPLGISFFGTAFSEPTLIKLASGFEAATRVRAKNLPTFAPMTPYNNIQGTTLRKPPRKAAPMAPKPDADKKTARHL